MTNIKAVFFDIDGTLLSFKTHAIPTNVVDAILFLQKKGVKIVIATGRAYCDIPDFCGLKFEGYITANGAYCVNKELQVLFKNLIPQENLNRLIDYQAQHPFPCVFVTDRGNFVNYIDESVVTLHKLVNLEIPPVRSMTEVINYEIFQIDAYFTIDREQKIMNEVFTDCEANRWHPAFVDINLKNNNKATGIEAFLKHFDIEVSESMAFGDGGNDIAMLEYVGIGVAMGNAGDNVKRAADYITTHVDEEGIMQALKYFKLIS